MNQFIGLTRCVPSLFFSSSLRFHTYAYVYIHFFLNRQRWSKTLPFWASPAPLAIWLKTCFPTASTKTRFGIVIYIALEDTRTRLPLLLKIEYLRKDSFRRMSISHLLFGSLSLFCAFFHVLLILPLTCSFHFASIFFIFWRVLGALTCLLFTFLAPYLHTT